MKCKRRWQAAKIGIVLAAIMLASVLAAMVPMVSATIMGDNTIKVTVTDGDYTGESDTVDIIVLEKAVVFDLPSTVLIGDKIKIKGTVTSGTYVTVYIDDVLYTKLANIVIKDAEFYQEVKTTDIGMNLPGPVRLKAWIDCECHVHTGEESTTDKPTWSPDGEGTILVWSPPPLTAYLSVPAVAVEDDFTVFGTAQGQMEVVILSVPPKGGGGKSLLDKGDKGLSPRKASVSMTDDTYSKKMTVQEDATAGYYDIYVLCAGMDGEWGTTGQEDLEAALDERYGIPSLTEGVITTKTQAEIEDILEDLVTTPGSDDLMVELRLKVETAYVKLDPVADVTVGEPLVVTGTSNRQEGYVIVVTCKGPVELAPHTVKVENGTFGCVFDTTDAVPGMYTVIADDGDGHTDEKTVNILPAITLPVVTLVKSCSPSIVPPGGNVTYTINYTNSGEADLHNVVITEYYPKGVTFISASPAPDQGTNIWVIGTLAAKTSGIINITVKVPESRTYSFFESGGVTGEGFVMVSKDIATGQKSDTLTNVVTLSCTELGPVSATASTTVSAVSGTSISVTEHGSGIYESDESLMLCSKNRSISIVKSTNAVYRPTTFNFSKSFSVNFTPKWKQDIETKNCVLDAAIRKLITDATYIEDEMRSKADNTSTTMEFDSSFNGSLYIGARTNDTAISETYIGEFNVLQDIQIGEGPIPSPSPTPTPDWLP